jgi:hypothetical protein
MRLGVFALRCRLAARGRGSEDGDDRRPLLSASAAAFHRSRKKGAARPSGPAHRTHERRAQHQAPRRPNADVGPSVLPELLSRSAVLHWRLAMLRQLAQGRLAARDRGLNADWFREAFAANVSGPVIPGRKSREAAHKHDRRATSDAHAHRESCWQGSDVARVHALRPMPRRLSSQPRLGRKVCSGYIPEPTTDAPVVFLEASLLGRARTGKALSDSSGVAVRVRPAQRL